MDCSLGLRGRPFKGRFGIVLREHLLKVRMRVPTVNHDWLPKFFGEVQLPAKERVLLLFGILHPRIIQAEFTDRHNLRMLEQLFEFHSQRRPLVRSRLVPRGGGESLERRK